MHRLALPLLGLLVGATLVATATAATDPALPPAGAYAVSSDVKGSFKINVARTALTDLRLSFVVGPTGQCSSPKLKPGKVVLSVAEPLKLTAAHRGGVTAYIIGRSTPATSSGVSMIPLRFKLSPGGRTSGTMSLTFRYNLPKAGDGELVLDGCSLFVTFHKT